MISVLCLGNLGNSECLHAVCDLRRTNRVVNRDSFEVETEVNDIQMDVDMGDVLRPEPGYLYCNS